MEMNKTVCYLNSNDGSSILAFGEKARLKITSEKALVALQQFLLEHPNVYLFGYLSYDLKNEMYDLSSDNEDGLEFPTLFFWEPSCVVKIANVNVEFLQGENTAANLLFVSEFLEEQNSQTNTSFGFEFKARTSKETYLTNLVHLKNYIQRGDIYEVNYCQEFYCENATITSPLQVYRKLNQLTKAPFSSYFHFDDFTLFCGSPERFIKKNENRLVSQPIKGTAARNAILALDEQARVDLMKDPKERAENIMIVDLVRNDLSKIALPKSVLVDELCGVYSFENVHQMISTISCEMNAQISFTDILRATFPMGSMTGAPKLKAMEIIEETEDFKRGLYSGSIGYITPNGDFDFNVVIRSLLYNEVNSYLSCAVGSAITIQSNPDAEYEECFTKIKRILDGLHA